MSVAGEVQARYEEIRLRALDRSEDLCSSVFKEPLRSFCDRFMRLGILGLFDDDPTGESWRQLSPEDGFKGLRTLELVGVERRDSPERWSRVYEILKLRAELLDDTRRVDGSDETERRINHEVCLVR